MGVVVLQRVNPLPKHYYRVVRQRTLYIATAPGMNSSRKTTLVKYLEKPCDAVGTADVAAEWW